ncbi:MAG: pteridine reductase [Porticoccus sp.]|jgi:pteridine reductase
MTNLLKRPAALVTGGATRLGFSFAYALAAAGYDIALHYHQSEDKAEQAAESIKALGVSCKIFPFDLSEQDPESLIKLVAIEFPTLQLLINSASSYKAATIAHTDLALLQRQFTVNFFAPFLLTSAFSAHCLKGCVINILDNKIAFQQNDYAAYLLSKKALAEFTQLAAMEYAPRIRINGIAPGVVMPGIERSDDYIAWRVDGIPLKHQGRVDDVLKAMHYLLNNEFVTGQILTVDGGEGINHQGLNAEQFNSKNTL